jgi:hypothetical protein
MPAAAEGYVLSNPLSGGELVLVGITGLIGYGLADFVGRYMETTAVAAGAALNSVPAGATVPNDQATIGFPSWQSMAAQFGIAAVPGIAAAFVDSPWGRAALQGMMLGAGFSLFGGIFKGLMAKMIGGTPLGQQLYLAEVEAQAAAGAAAPATTTAPAPGSTPLQGLPRGVGRRPALRDPGPMARGMGQPATASALAPAPSPLTVNTPNVPQNMPLPFTTPPFTSGGPGNPAPPLATPGGAPATPLDQPSLPMGAHHHPQHHMYAPPGILTNTGDVVPTAPPGTPTPGGPNTGPMCAPCTSTSGGVAATHQSAMDAIRDESCLGALPRGFGMYASFPAEEQ